MSYSPEERDEIIAHVLVQVATGRFVSRILDEDETTETGVKMPAISTFWLWCFAGEDADEISEKLARARGQGVEALLDQCGPIADEVAADRDAVAKAKLRVETRVKLAQMLQPRKYGPKLDLTSGGEKLGLSAELEAARRRASE